MIYETWPSAARRTRARSTWSNAATAALAARRAVGDSAAARASPSPPASPPPRPRSRSCVARVATMPGGHGRAARPVARRHHARRGVGRAGPRRRSGRGEATHPQYHLKLLLRPDGDCAAPRSRAGAGRRGTASSPARGRAVANAMAAPAHLAQMGDTAAEPSGGSTASASAELPDSGVGGAGDCTGAARGARDAGQDARRSSPPTAQLAQRVSALLARWGIEADDSAGRPLSEPPPGTLAARHCERCGGGASRRSPCSPCSSIRWSAARGRSGSRGSTRRASSISSFAGRGRRRAWRASTRVSARSAPVEQQVRPRVAALDGLFAESICRSPSWRSALVDWRHRHLPASAAWRGPAGRMAAELLADLQASRGGGGALPCGPRKRCRCFAPVARGRRFGRRYGGHPRHCDLGPARSAAAARRPRSCSAGSTRAVARAAGARPVASAKDPRRAWHADARKPDRPCRARFRKRARRA